ncbi:hypothetical protein GCM10023115_46850 [Pontixanthobacter gangjinensis]|uniref:Porin family protein n=1 Tax=Christiangramia aestuarii TaxID=1028746 RepID=A0A7M3SX92_9FLAO|nr:outer membrane beta-barrel protein [Christiangramia aestuarii]MUP41223.1 porin family protein [Christiangramia aestuarii]
MKTFILTIALVFFGFVAGAQNESDKFLIEKGTWSLGGSVGVNSNNSDNENSEYENFGFTLRPQAGYFINDNLAAGLTLGYHYSRNKYTRPDELQEATNNAFTIAPYLQKYFAISGSFSFNLTGFLEYTRSTSKNDYDNCLNCQKDTRNLYGIALRPGLSYLLSDKFSLDANLGTLQYSHSEFREDGIDRATTNSFAFSFGLSNIYLGLTFYLN